MYNLSITQYLPSLLFFKCSNTIKVVECIKSTCPLYLKVEKDKILIKQTEGAIYPLSRAKAIYKKSTF